MKRSCKSLFLLPHFSEAPNWRNHSISIAILHSSISKINPVYIYIYTVYIYMYICSIYTLCVPKYINPHLLGQSRPIWNSVHSSCAACELVNGTFCIFFPVPSSSSSSPPRQPRIPLCVHHTRPNLGESSALHKFLFLFSSREGRRKRRRRKEERNMKKEERENFFSSSKKKREEAGQQPPSFSKS